MTDFSNKILDKIKENKIEPTSKWFFIVKNYLIWVLFGFSILVGSIAVSVTIYAIKASRIGGYAEFSFFKKMLFLLPIFWLVLILVFVLLAFYNLKQTKKAYKLNSYLLISISILLSVIIGATIHFVGMSRHIENSVYQHLPLYQSIHEKRMQIWSKPELGRLQGVILIINEESFNLRDIKNKEWKVFPQIRVELSIGDRVRLLGKELSKTEFEANEIIPWFMKCEQAGRPCERNLFPSRITR